MAFNDRLLTTPIDEPDYWGKALPTVEVTPEKRYVARYNKDGNPIYTTDPALSMGNSTNAPISKKDFMGFQSTNYTKPIVQGIDFALGLPMATIAAGPLVAETINTASPIINSGMNILANPASSIMREAATSIPSIQKGIPIAEAFDKALLYTIGASGVYDSAKSLYDGIKPWYEGIPEGVLSGMMLSGALPMRKINTSLDALEKASSVVAKHPGWSARAVLDGVTNPVETYKAVKNGTYVLDFPSLMRNTRRVLSEVEAGIQSTNNMYRSLTGLTIGEPTVRPRSWKHFNFGTDAFYSPRTASIHVPVTESRFSNHTAGSHHNKFLGGHEQTHYANDALNDTFHTPPLGIYKKWLGPIYNDYYVPNKAHPIAKKYKWKFLSAPFAHGRYPEETWANFMGSRAAGDTYKEFVRDNFFTEGIFNPKPFIEDYSNYLTDTYF